MYSNWTVYFTYARLAYQRQSAYRVAVWIGLFTQLGFLFFRGAVFESLYEPHQSIRGMSLAQAMTYVCLTQALIWVIPLWGNVGVDEDIRTGQIASHLSKPVNYYYSVLWQRMGLSCFYLLFQCPIVLGVGWWSGFLVCLPSVYHFCLFLASVLCGAFIATSLLFLAELSAFWLGSARGMKALMYGLINFFSGLTLPLVFFPSVFQTISRFLPFEYTLGTPALLYLGLTPSPLRLLGAQLVWVVLISLICCVGLRLGERKVVIHGG